VKRRLYVREVDQHPLATADAIQTMRRIRLRQGDFDQPVAKAETASLFSTSVRLRPPRAPSTSPRGLGEGGSESEAEENLSPRPLPRLVR